MELLDWLFPRYCLGCGTVGVLGCARCLAGVPLLPVDALGRIAGVDEAWAGFAYAQPILKRLVRGWKYEGWHEVEPAIVSLIDRWSLAHGAALVPEGVVVVPVPLHPLRFQERGFNQAEAISLALARTLELEHDASALHRTRYNTPQAKSHDRSAIGGTGLFIADSARVRGRTVLLCDDVLTTGATAQEATLALKAAGAAQVFIFTLAYSGRHLN
jgi:ComF family protein